MCRSGALDGARMAYTRGDFDGVFVCLAHVDTRDFRSRGYCLDRTSTPKATSLHCLLRTVR